MIGTLRRRFGSTKATCESGRCGIRKRTACWPISWSASWPMCCGKRCIKWRRPAVWAMSLAGSSRNWARSVWSTWFYRPATARKSAVAASVVRRITKRSYSNDWAWPFPGRSEVEMKCSEDFRPPGLENRAFVVTTVEVGLAPVWRRGAGGVVARTVDSFSMTLRRRGSLDHPQLDKCRPIT